MRILVDAMGGDLAPDEIVKGAVHAQQELGAEIVLVGQRAAIEACLRNEQAKLEIIDASEVITMDDDPSTATRRKKDASMTVALNMLRDGKGDAVVSAGSTGALLTGATLIVKRIHGIRRAALAPVLPNGDAGVMLIDCGANADCTPEYLLQFAYMGSYYARTMLGIAAPRVGLLSNGTEDHKGSELQHETFPLLKAADAAGRIRFVGNVEASQVFSGDVDVECGKGNVLCLHKCGCFLFYTDTQIGFCHAGQSIKSCLEVCFLALQDELEVGSQRVAVESGDKDCFRRHRRVGDYVVRTLADKGEHTGLQQCVLHFLCAHLGRVHLAELLVVLLSGSLYHDVQHLTTRSEERRVGKECRSRWSPYH